MPRGRMARMTTEKTAKMVNRTRKRREKMKTTTTTHDAPCDSKVEQ